MGNKQSLLEIQSLTVILSTFFTYKAFIIFKLRIFNLVLHSSYSSQAVRSQDSEQSYSSIFRKTSPSLWTTFTRSEWTTGKTSNSAHTAILTAVGSAGNTCFILRSALALVTPRNGSSAPPTYAAHIKKAKHHSRCSTDSSDHLTHSLTETSCAKHIPCMQDTDQFSNAYSTPGSQIHKATCLYD